MAKVEFDPGIDSVRGILMGTDPFYIRPLCMIEEKDIKAYAALQGYQKQQKLCPYETNSHRAEIKQLYESIERMNPEARYSMWNALNSDNKLIEE